MIFHCFKDMRPSVKRELGDPPLCTLWFENVVAYKKSFHIQRGGEKFVVPRVLVERIEKDKERGFYLTLPASYAANNSLIPG